MMRSLKRLCCLALLVATFGCGDQGPGLIPVTGKITYAGGAWPKGGMINFNPVEPAAGFPRLNGTAEFGPDGSFVVKSTGDKQGLVPGKYAINIECWETTPSMETGAPGKSYVPGTFQAPAVEIAVGDKSKEVTFDVPKS